MSRPQKRDLTEESFHALLAFLSPDPVHAAQHYERIREKLARFFEWKGCIPGDEYADETIDRVARRLQNGIGQPPENPYLFFHGVAVNVVRERWRKAERDPQPLDALPASASPRVDPFEAERARSGEEETGRRLACLHTCLDRLPPVSRELLTTYHLGGSGIHIARRKTLAESLNLPAGALRLRVYRIRRQLEQCVFQCLKRPAQQEH